MRLVRSCIVATEYLGTQPAFQAAYREAREQTVRRAVGRLQGLLATCGTAEIELRAAVAVFELAYKGGEAIDLAERVSALEAGARQDEEP